MSTTTQEDYFGDTVDPPRRRHKHRHRHSKSRSYASGTDSDEEQLSPKEVIHEEREYKKPGSKHRHRETVDIVYEPSKSDTDDASTDDGKKRRRRHRHRRHEKIPDDVSGIVPDASSGTDVDESTTASTSSGRMRRRARSAGESALAVLGLEDTYKRARSKSRGRRHSLESDEGYDSTSERARSRSRMNSNTAQAAIIAAAVEAFRARKEPGGVTGSKSLKRVIEAALASGAVEKFLDRKGEDDSKSNKRIAESVLAGLATQRGINGKRSKRRSLDDESTNPVKELAASGLIAAAGKKLLDYQRSRSQSRPRGRSESGERPRLDRRRSHSVGEALAALGLSGLAAESLGKSRRNSRSSRSSRIRDDTSSDSSLSDSDMELDEEGERKRHNTLRRKEIIGIALAILATVHLGHTAYEAKEKRANRKEQVESGRITEEEADHMKRKSLLGDATTVGLAVLAATEAVKAWKEMNKRRQEYHTFEQKHHDIEEHRRRKAIQHALNGTAPVPPAGEASKYYSQPGYMGPPPGARDVPTYPSYPSSGPIPVPRDAYGSKDAYTKNGREIPVVYPSSVTHA